MKTTVIHHSADHDGIFCREIARKFLPKDTEFIGWDFTDPPLKTPTEGQIYVLDLPVDRVFGFEFTPAYVGDLESYEAKGSQDPAFLAAKHALSRIIWIDHHKSSIETHPASVPGYRIDGVAACRLAWQWFTSEPGVKWFPGASCPLPDKQAFVERKVSEPLAVRLAGEYDVWDHRGDGDLEFQLGLDAFQPTVVGFNVLLKGGFIADHLIKNTLIPDGAAAMRCYAKRDADTLRSRSFLATFAGLKFLCLNTARCNSNTFAARDLPETGHDALLAFSYNGKKWMVSLYHAAHRKDLDLSVIAKARGGGGHAGACGFTLNEMPVLGRIP